MQSHSLVFDRDMGATWRAVKSAMPDRSVMECTGALVMHIGLGLGDAYYVSIEHVA